jgi:hypothetical protein
MALHALRYRRLCGLDIANLDPKLLGRSKEAYETGHEHDIH